MKMNTSCICLMERFRCNRRAQVLLISAEWSFTIKSQILWTSNRTIYPKMNVIKIKRWQRRSISQSCKRHLTSPQVRILRFHRLSTPAKSKRDIVIAGIIIKAMLRFSFHMKVIAMEDLKSTIHLITHLLQPGHGRQITEATTTQAVHWETLRNHKRIKHLI